MVVLLQELPRAASEKDVLVKAQVHESELKRCTGMFGDVEISIVLTNQRLLLQALHESGTTFDNSEDGEPVQNTDPLAAREERTP